MTSYHFSKFKLRKSGLFHVSFLDNATRFCSCDLEHIRYRSQNYFRQYYVGCLEERIETVLETGTALCTLLRLYHEEDDDNNVNISETSDFFTIEQEKRQQQITCITSEFITLRFNNF